MRQSLVPRSIPGATLVRLATAAGVRVHLKGEIQRVFLRWGHSARSIQMSLTCCPERRELAASCSPDVLADHIACAESKVCPGVPPLVDVLTHSGHLGKVSFEWLRSRIPYDYWLAYALERGGHLTALTATWLADNIRDEEALSFALASGGFLRAGKVDSEWLAAKLRKPSVLLQALKEIPADVPAAWAAKKFSDFGDFVECMGSRATTGSLFDEYSRWFRTSERPPTDLARALIRLNESALTDVVMDAATVLYHLQGVPRALVEDVINSCDQITGTDAFISAHRREDGDLAACERAIAAWGWHGSDAMSLAVAIANFEDLAA